ncbi:hypothetical protein [Winogradskyella flava]|uniref:Uncharacterized protein n=1 Tax=Winogradskyella flava TaxID=1884876 RepID=A0A842IQE4_9FLAO|nr:hypothetical protein [Winogradskyella flava]MBC2844935.1 hypothetical protein [Winogradskyella flava]
MKKIVLLFTGLLMGLTTVTAAEKISANQSTDLDLTSRYRYIQPILFVERGVEFLIFADGSFDFNTDVFSTVPDNDNYYYRRNRRGSNRTYGAPGTRYHRGDRGVLVTHDRLGRVRRIGNVFINYDRQGRIKRAGSVYMNYRRGQLKQVGGLRVLYNRYGVVIGTRGHVNLSNQGCGFCGTTGCTIDHFDDHSYDDDWNDDWDDDDDNYYYYRKNGKVKKQKKIKF